MNLKDFNSIAERLGARPEYRGTVITVHGIKTRGAWQKDVTPVFQDAGLRHEPVDYGYALFNVVFRRLQDTVAKRVVDAVIEQERVVPGGPHGVIAHSFGTLCLGRALRVNPSLRLGRICLFGSILPTNFPWYFMWNQGQFELVMNETCEKDRWPRHARRWLRWAGAGASGCVGFNPSLCPVFECPYDWTEHSSLATRLHCERVWIPFLLEGIVPVSGDPVRRLKTGGP